MNHKKKNLILFTIPLFAVLLFALCSSLTNKPSPQQTRLQAISCVDPEPFYLGVTYGGDSVDEAKKLIDKVKTYTNLIVIQSGQWQMRPDKLSEVCDYAVNCKMNFIVYFGHQHATLRNSWLSTFNPAWENYFLGVYFGDEMGGKMLDDNVWFSNDLTFRNLNKFANGSFSVNLPETGSTVIYQPDGSIVLSKYSYDSTIGKTTFITYYTDGTVITEIQEKDNPRIQTENGRIDFTYEEIWKMRPFQTYDETAERFIHTHTTNFNVGLRPTWNITHFSSDYALYWFDYLSGYDVLLAQIGWNHTIAQDIALVRGAANMQNKDWGGIITWKYTQPPYLDSGSSIYEQMRVTYEAGAKYIIIFTYSEDMEGPYGTLQEEHFAALERFWNEVAQNTNVKQGSASAEAVLVLPHNYGWGMRHPNDNIWGLWKPDSTSAQIWQELQQKLAQYGIRLDIIYDDDRFSVEEKYSKVYLWNHTR